MKHKLKAFIMNIVFFIALIPFGEVYLKVNAGGNTVKYQSVHDPSIVVGYMDKTSYSSRNKIYGVQNKAGTRTEVYFIFGSHRDWAYSMDLQKWEKFTNNINNDYENLFKEGKDWASLGDSSYSLTGNTWAPDVIWNPTMKKWTMYMSINGLAWNSCIFLLTADTLNGDWTAKGCVIYSGFTDKGSVRDYTKTDYVKATGDNSLNSRYRGSSTTWSSTKASTWNTSYGAHAIDPCVFYGKDKKLYLTYGSWSGGMYLIQLDKTTGLRDYTIKYEYKKDVSDPYMGYKIAGGQFVSGEASYIQYITNYYYLFVTYGGLTANGGYNMRVFRSKDPKGPYVDSQGNNAIYKTYSDNINGSIGVRLLTYYKWNYMDQGFVAQGHNSAFVDDGKAFVVYHTRYTDSNEWHTVRVHQLFVNEKDWLVTAPFQFSGEELQYINANDIPGTYEAIFHTSVTYASKKTTKIHTLTLGSNNRVTGTKSGSWNFSSEKGSPYVTFTFNKVTYYGVFVKQRKEAAGDAGATSGYEIQLGSTVVTFAALGENNIEMFAYKTN